MSRSSAVAALGLVATVSIVVNRSWQGNRMSGLMGLPITLDPSQPASFAEGGGGGGGERGQLWQFQPEPMQAVHGDATAAVRPTALGQNAEGVLSMELPSDSVRDNWGKGSPWLHAAQGARLGEGESEFELDPRVGSKLRSLRHAVVAHPPPPKPVRIAPPPPPPPVIAPLPVPAPKVIDHRIKRISVFDQVLPPPPCRRRPFDGWLTLLLQWTGPAFGRPMENPVLHRFDADKAHAECAAKCEGERPGWNPTKSVREACMGDLDPSPNLFRVGVVHVCFVRMGVKCETVLL